MYLIYYVFCKLVEVNMYFVYNIYCIHKIYLSHEQNIYYIYKGNVKSCVYKDR